LSDPREIVAVWDAERNGGAGVGAVRQSSVFDPVSTKV